MTAKKPSQTELYGEVLTNEQQYRKELSFLPSLASEGEQALLDHARQGDKQAREELVCALLSRIERRASNLYRAYAWASHRIEYADVIQEGNLALWQLLDKALSQPNPCGYLLAAAYDIMRAYVFHKSQFIVPPRTRGIDAFEVVSLDVPLEEDESITWGDMFVQETTVSVTEASTEEVTQLYQEVEALPEQQQRVVIHRYGLYDEPSEAAHILIKQWQCPPTQVYYVEKKALAHLYERLVLIFPHYASCVLHSQKPTRQHAIQRSRVLTQDCERRLDEALTVLQAQGKPVTAKALATLAHIHTDDASYYLQQREPERLRSSEQRILAACQSLQAQGMAITGRSVAAKARINRKLVDAYLREHPEWLPQQEPLEQRLEQAMEALQAHGKKVTINTLAKEARCATEAAMAFLQQRRGRKDDAQRRLKEAYSQMVITGEKITCLTLSEKAQVHYSTAADFLRVVRSQEKVCSVSA